MSREEQRGHYFECRGHYLESLWCISGPSILGRPNLQEVPETLLLRAHLRAFSKLFLDQASFLWLEVVLRSQFSIEVLAEKAWRKMSVRIKLKNLTTDFIQMGFNHVVSLIQVPCDTQKSKNGLPVRYMYVKKMP